MSSNENLSDEDKELLAKYEEELKDRYTENDVEFMKVYNAEPITPPIIESWWIPHNQGRKNDRRFNRHSHPYERYGDRNISYHDRSHNSQYSDRSNHSYNRGYRNRHNY